MALAITDCGDWVPYAPLVLPAGYPANTMFCRRVSDGVDWYTLAHGGSLAGYPLVATALAAGDGTFVVQAVANEPQKLFPQNCRLIAISGYAGSQPQADLGRQVYNPGAKTLSAPPVLPSAAPRTAKADIWRRCSDAQAVTLANLLSQRTVREQGMFNDANFLSHGDPEYPTLYAAVSNALGKTEADRILAAS
jgi:hypothetical protein